MGNQVTIIDQTEQITNNYKTVEKEIHNNTKNINVNLSKLDLSKAIESFKQLETLLATASFEKFISSLEVLKQGFGSFQDQVKSSSQSVNNFTKKFPEFKETTAVTNVQINGEELLSNLDKSIDNAAASVGSASTEIGASISTAASGIGSAATEIGASIGTAATGIGAAAESIGASLLTIGTGISLVIDSATNFLLALAQLNGSFALAAAGIGALIPLLPELGLAILNMAINMGGLLAYLPELIIFLAIVAVLSLLGEGLSLAGQGLMGVGAGLTSMSEGMTALLTFFPFFLECLANTELSVGGIIKFVFLAAAMLAMAIAMQIMNKEFDSFVDNMGKMHGFLSVGFVALFAVFAVTMIGMSLFVDKVAKGMNKVTMSIDKQIKKLAILNPLLAAQAILMNPIMGMITVGLAVAGGLLVKALIPAMATGGVVSKPTMALVGEGRYPEAVVPLGNSPQFAQMKNDITAAVLQGMSAMGGCRTSSAPMELVLTLDGEKFARTIIPAIDRENRRKGLRLQVREV